MLAAGADVNAENGHLSLTTLAAAVGYEDVMVLLLLAGAHYEDLAGCYQLQNYVDLGTDEGIKRAKWRTYLQRHLEEDPMTDCYRPRSGLGSIDREFFHALKNHVKHSCGTEMGSIQVKEAVELFLNWRVEEKQRKVRGEIREAIVQAGYAASGNVLCDLPT